MKTSKSKLNLEERAHHVDSASSLQDKEWCEGFQSQDGANEAAERGTLCHKALETRDLSGLGDEEALAVTRVLDYIDRTYRDLVKRFGKADVQVFQEAALPIDDEKHPTGVPHTSSGWCDVAFVFDKQQGAHIIDAKFVRWEVEPAENNLQGICYMLGLKKRFPTLTRCTVSFAMPYLNSIDTHTFPEEQFGPLYLRVKSLVARRHGPSPQLRPGFPVCLYCANIAACVACAQFVRGSTSKVRDLEVPPRPLLEIQDPDEFARAIRWLDILGAYASGGRALITERIFENPNLKPADYDMISQQKREIINMAAFVERLRAIVPAEQVEQARKVTLTDAEKLIRGATPRGLKEQAVEHWNAALATLGITQPGEPKNFLRAKKTAPED